MMKKSRKILAGALGVLMAFGLYACGGSGAGNTASQSSDGVSAGGSVIDSVADSTGGEAPADDYVYDGTPTVAPYVIYNEDGTKSDDESVGENAFGNMFVALRTCGLLASNGNKMYIEDANGLRIFQRQGNSQYFVYDGTNFVSDNMRDVEAEAYVQEHPRAYVLNGRGTDYVYLGVEHHTEEHNPEEVYEVRAGGHSYLYSPVGILQTGSGGTAWEEYGYAYASAVIRLSEARYKNSAELGKSGCNAYIFFNIRSGMQNCDLGIGAFGRDHGEWKLVHNCTSTEHAEGSTCAVGYYIDAEGNKTVGGSAYQQQGSENRFSIWEDYIVTTMDRDENGVYSGADDLFLEVWATVDTWNLRVVNLRTGEEWGYTHTHENLNAGNEGYFRVVACTSHCPGVGDVWDARDEGFIKNVVWEDVKVARYNEDDVYTDEDKAEFSRENGTIQYAFTQGADCAHLEFGVHGSDGFYESGAPYEAGASYLVFSSYYDGTHVQDGDWMRD